MKTRAFTLTLFLTFAVSFAFAQRTYDQAIPVNGDIEMPQAAGFEMALDTLFPDFLNLPCGGSNYVIFTSSNGGYVVGSNGYGDTEKVQRFDMSLQAAEITAFWPYFGGKEVIDDRLLTAVVYSDNSGEPGTLLGTSEPILTSEADTTDLTRLSFIPPVAVNGSFFIGMDFSNLYTGPTDTTYLGMTTTDDGCSSGSNALWEQWNDGSWYSVSSASSWDLDIEFLAGVVISFESAALEDAFAIHNGLTLYPAFPNPVVDETTLNFELANPSEVLVELFDVNGKLLSVQELGTVAAGEHLYNIDLSAYPAGTYVYSIHSDEARLMSRIVKQ